MPESTAAFSHWFSSDPTARNGLIISAWQAKGSARRYLASIADERLRDMVRHLTPGEVTDVAGNCTSPFMAVPVTVYVSALEAEHRSLRNENKQIADALAAEMIK